jgi:Tol biopolymer transport system component
MWMAAKTTGRQVMLMFKWDSRTAKFLRVTALCVMTVLIAGCGDDISTAPETREVPHEGRWGIYVLDLSSQDVALLYSTNDEIAVIDLSTSGTLLAFSQKTPGAGTMDTTAEIYAIGTTGGSPDRLTNNVYFDAYPSFSPTDAQIVFLSQRGSTLDLYIMDIDGAHQQLLYNSGGHDADVDWGNGGRIVFTRDYQIWSVKSDGSDPRQITDPAGAGTWGQANLPLGDYDPRYSPDGSRIAFERMVDASFANGGYDIYVVSADGSAETPLTNTGAQGYAQGFANWSHAGDRLVYILAAAGTEGRYDLYLMNSDGSDNQTITPGYFPAAFLCLQAVFSADDSEIYFIGQWWQ